MDRRKFLTYLGCGCCGFVLNACSTAPITERRQLKIIPESKLNAQAAQVDEKVKKQFGGAFNTIKALRRVNKSLKIDVVTILGKDHIGNIAIKELKKNKVGTKNIIRSEQTNDDIILINQKNNSKTVFPLADKNLLSLTIAPIKVL